MDISLVTIVKNRRAALLNMIKGLECGTQHPAELIIVHMNEEVYELPACIFPVKQVVVNSVHHLPLAAARNAAVTFARHDQVVFLDVDCIPASDFLSLYNKAFNDRNALISGRVRYLTAQAMKKDDLIERMKEYSIPDPVRGNVDQYPYELFWSLNFGCNKSVFWQIGGFDEFFTGYGAEDTDFAFAAKFNGVPMNTINAMAFHQYHPSYDPPMNHLIDIISNATAFRKKWGIWPMEGWLAKFEHAGLIKWSDEDIELKCMPSALEMEKALKLT
ncbi:Glycosyltransferase, GT2 family [Pedobacter terrae]|uniref:Glycosyltransferase, GT2 family n=1 Tax=Pedobacter terrae TaxID=405671 RepID=A0A1G7MWM2_9SPHI|nr:galactosyltransferase-related protein [Pedobacter terrae]SDF66198.1 Glycosyltransferase, GT2 family [Pedobacter terrae]